MYEFGKNINGDNMNHSIDLKNYDIRTDLIDEEIENKNIKNINSYEKKIDNIKINRVIIDKNNEKYINKKRGEYITISFNDITDFNNREKVKQIFSLELKHLLKKMKIKKDSSFLIVGLGNEKSTPDSLGPLSIKNIIVTNHIYELNELEDGFRRVSIFIPNVKGVTGIETSDLIESITNKIKPDYLIVIDALASSSIDRLNKTIQITNTGIAPGSGVKNKRKEISYNTLNIPVIAIGIPTVLDATIIVSDTIKYMQKHYVFNKKFQHNPMSKLTISSTVNYLNDNVIVTNQDKIELMGLLGNFNDYELRQLIYEVLNPIGYNLMVTPKEIDFLIEKLADVIGNGINKALHEKVDKI